MRERRSDLNIPETLDRAVMKTLRKSIAERPADAAELERMLLEIPIVLLAKSYPPGTPKTTAPSSSRWTQRVRS
jgi:hypothetical protein